MSIKFFDEAFSDLAFSFFFSIGIQRRATIVTLDIRSSSTSSSVWMADKFWQNHFRPNWAHETNYYKSSARELGDEKHMWDWEGSQFPSCLIRKNYCSFAPKDLYKHFFLEPRPWFLKLKQFAWDAHINEVFSLLAHLAISTWCKRILNVFFQ